MVSGEKRNCEEETVLEGITAILLDIEGTTTSIKYVKDILFPYVRDNLKSYVDSHWNDDEFKADLEALKLQAKKDEEDKIENFCPIEEGDQEKESLIKNVLWQMDLDRKTTALKQLQGHIWREGYENGKLKGHVYEDVAQMFKKWSEDGRKLYIYSSGSVEAQKLLFKHSESGDLQGFLSGYFDTEIGPKTEAVSYTNIAKAMGCEPCQILFITDIMKEATAADKAGMQVMIAIREGNAPLPESDLKSYTTINSFKDVVLESCTKKKKICEEEDIRQAEKTENVEKTEESECKNGEAEKMEVEPSEAVPEETKTEENGQTKTDTTEAAGAESENVDVDVDDSNVEAEAGEKVVSSSVGESEAAKEPESKEPSASKEDAADSTEETAVETNVEMSEAGEEPKEKAEANEADEGKQENSVNGHENGEHKEENGKEASEEANGQLEEVEAVPVKKMTAEDQADSTVEVTA